MYNPYEINHDLMTILPRVAAHDLCIIRMKSIMI